MKIWRGEHSIASILKTKSEFVSAAAILFGLLIGVGCGPHADIVTPEATAMITGVVLNPSLAKVPAAKVQIEPRGATPCKFDTFSRVDGSYELEGICPGLYDVVASALIGTTTQRVRLRFVQLSAGQISAIPDLVLKAPSTVSGRVYLQGSADHSGVSVSLVGTDRTATSAVTSTFTIPDVEEGTYAINFLKEGYIQETISNLAVPAGTAFSVPTDVTLKALYPASTGSIRGQVSLEARSDHSGIVVQVDGTTRNVVTTSGGAFVFDGLPVSTYSLTFRKQYFFDKTVGPLTMVAGSSGLVVPAVQLDSHRILNASVQAFGVVHSPNGSQLAWSSSSSATNGEVGLTDPTVQIFRQIITSGARVTPQAGLSWAPNGQEILFIRGFSGSANTSAIGVVGADGSGMRSVLPEATQYLRPTWSPDGNSFAYFRNPDIRTIRVDRSSGSLVATTSTSQVIDTINGVVSMTGMAWSVTGRVYYSYDQNSGSGLRSAGIYTVYSSGGGRLQITPATSESQAISAPDSPTIRPDGNRIGFSWRYTPATGEPPNGIYIMDLDGTNATRISTVPGSNLDWAPNGSRITFTKPATDSRHPSRICEVLVPQ